MEELPISGSPTKIEKLNSGYIKCTGVGSSIDIDKIEEDKDWNPTYNAPPEVERHITKHYKEERQHQSVTDHLKTEIMVES